MKKLFALTAIALMVNSAIFAQTEGGKEKKEAPKQEVKKEKPAPLAVGDKCPDLKFIDVNDKVVSLSDFKGKYIMIDIWATWCPPCKKEIPHLKKLEERMHGEKIAFLSISSDKDVKMWKEFVQNNGMGGNQLSINGDWTINNLFEAKFIPHFILLDKKGRVVETKMALRPSSGDEIYNYLMSLKGI